MRDGLDRFHLISVFVAVVDTQGFAGAARKLAISPPAVTRAVNELESHLGLRLLTLTAPVLFGGLYVTPNPEWRLLQDGLARSVRLQARMTTTTNDSAMAAVVGGFGVTRLLSYQVAEHLRGDAARG